MCLYDVYTTYYSFITQVINVEVMIRTMLSFVKNIIPYKIAIKYVDHLTLSGYFLTQALTGKSG